MGKCKKSNFEETERGNSSDKEKGYHVQSYENCERRKKTVKTITFAEVAVVTVVTEAKLLYFQNDWVGLALAWCLQQAAERLWKPAPLAPSGLNLLLLHLLLLLFLLMLREFLCTGLYLFVSSV